MSWRTTPPLPHVKQPLTPMKPQWRDLRKDQREDAARASWAS